MHACECVHVGALRVGAYVLACVHLCVLCLSDPVHVVCVCVCVAASVC